MLIFVDAPVYLSFPHFYKADPKLLEDVEGLSPDQEKHETFLKIQPVSTIMIFINYNHLDYIHTFKY